MKNKLVQLLYTLTAMAICSFSSNAQQMTYRLPAGVNQGDIQQGIIIFKLKPENREFSRRSEGTDKLNQALSSIGASTVQKMFPAKKAPLTERNALGQKMTDLSLIYQIHFNTAIPVEKAATALLRTGMVSYAEPKFLPKPFFNPNDPNIGTQYQLTKIQAALAFDLEQGDTSVVIGIVDTGSDLDHPDLVANLKRNYNDPQDGIDNDNDGYIDNWRGWDLGENDNDATCTADNHGSHVSGCAAAVTNNGTGVASPGFNCKFLPVKIADATGALTVAYEGITYAADAGCKIINCSWGGNGGGSFGQDVIDYATVNMDALVVAAAGNDGNENPFFPASYRYVLSVASTGNNDGKSSFSNYGAFVDVCAPGSNIYTAMYNNTYNFMSGTSMASPIAAGAAAIVKSHFPTYNAMQVGEKLRVTCDNIYTVGGNNAYLNKLGKGRINMYRSLTINSPSVRMNNIVTTDNNDNAFVVGDTLRVTGDITNYLDPCSNLTVTVSTTSTWVTIIDNSTTVGALGTMATANNNADPFQIKINAGTPLNTKVTLKFTFTDGTYTDVQLYDVTLNVDYINITINQVATTITSKGRLCYNGTGQTEGLGFSYNGENLVYEAGLMIGSSATKTSDNVRNNTATDDDFQSVQVVQKLSPAVQSDFDVYGKFNDVIATTPQPVVVSHKALAWANPGDDKYIIVEYWIKNSGTSNLNNLWAGVFADWDIQDYTLNKGDEVPSLKMGYAYNTSIGGLWAGTKVLTATPFNHYAIDNISTTTGANLSDGYSDAEKYTTLSTAMPTSGGTGTGNDVIDVVSTGPFNIAAGDSVKVAFALIAGDDLNDLSTSAANAQIKYDGLSAGMSDISSGSFAIGVAPNPAGNQISVITYGNVMVRSYEINDITGRNVLKTGESRLMNETMQIDISSLPSGTYFITAITNSGNAVRKFVKN